jgi:tRNA(fMet)-specific endonuclease VapC
MRRAKLFMKGRNQAVRLPKEFRRKAPTLLKKIENYSAGDLGISSITLSELQYGVEKSQQPERNKEALAQFLISLELASYGGEAALHYGRIRAILEHKGMTIGANDLFIVAHALALEIPLVTNNVREFSRIRGLKLENWIKD